MHVRKTKQTVNHLKGIDKSYPKIYFLLNLSHCIKSYGYLFQILALFTMSFDLRCKFRFYYFVLILCLLSGKVTKFLVEKLSTSEVISQKNHEEGWKRPPTAFRVNVSIQNVCLAKHYTDLFTTTKGRVDPIKR